MKLKTKDLALCALFAALIAVCAWISIPATVPFTLQTFAIFAALGLLGGKRGTVAVAVYLLLGAIGVPVFAGFQGGIGALLGTTGGYLLGFLLTALIVWGMEARFGSKAGVFRHGVVSCCLCAHQGSDLARHGAGLVCGAVFDSGRGENRAGRAAARAAQTPYSCVIGARFCGKARKFRSFVI